MATEVEQYLDILPKLLGAHDGSVWVSYDAEGDVLYINFTQPNIADYSDEIERDVLARYDNAGELIGYTVLNARFHSRSRAA